MLLLITQADSTQKAKMKPILASAEKRFEALRKNYTEREKKLMDSVQVQLKPVLREEQLKKLEEFKGYRRKKHFRN
jgi:hypothetical protein